MILYLAILYALGIGFLIGSVMMEYTIKHPSDSRLTPDEPMTPAQKLVVLIASPIIAIICGIYIFFCGTEE